MSRTIRRKNADAYVASWKWRFCGSKLFVHDVQDYCWFWREGTKEDYREAVIWIHGESSTSNHRSPGNSYRNVSHRTHRRHASRELHKVFRVPGYDPVLTASPPSCWWDWS